MNPRDMFEIAGGSIIGRDHRVVGKNNQDAFRFIAGEDMIIAIVCDGCGSSPHSEVGAKIGAQFIAAEIHASLTDQSMHCRPTRKDDWQFLLDCVYNKSFLETIEMVALDMIGFQEENKREFAAVIENYFLFTVVGAIITPRSTAIFSAGDGFYGINFRTGGFVNVIGPFAENAPPYPAYGLLGQNVDSGKKNWSFRLESVQITSDIQSLFIGTDGVADFAAAAEKNLPGRDEPLGALSQFWENDLYFRNPDTLRRRLAIANADVTKPNWEERRLMKYPGLLRDDTTLVVVRRKKL